MGDEFKLKPVEEGSFDSIMQDFEAGYIDAENIDMWSLEKEDELKDKGWDVVEQNVYGQDLDATLKNIPGTKQVLYYEDGGTYNIYAKGEESAPTYFEEERPEAATYEDTYEDTGEYNPEIQEQLDHTHNRYDDFFDRFEEAPGEEEPEQAYPTSAEEDIEGQGGGEGASRAA